MSKTLSKTTLDGSEPASGGFGVELTFNWLEGEIIKLGQMKKGNSIKQVDITKESIILLYDNYEGEM